MTPERRARGAVTTVFLLNGLLFGALVARMPAIRDHAGVSEGELGLALACSALGSIVAMPLAGGLAARHGSRQTTRVGLALACGAAILPVLAGSLPALAAGFLCLGLSFGALDVAMNAHGVAVERRYARPILSGFHAAFSLGGLLGAAVAAACAAADVDPRVQMAGVALTALAVGVPRSRWFLPAAEDALGRSEPAFAKPPRELWAVGALAFCCLLVEGASADWSAVYVQDELGGSAAVAALAFTAFSVTMVTGRLIGDRVVAAFGGRLVVRACGVFAAVGFGAALLTASVPAAIAGFACLGLGMAAVVPIAFRCGGTAPGIPPGVGVAAVSTMGYFGFIAGPPLIGGLAEATSLKTALTVLVAASAAVAALAPRDR